LRCASPAPKKERHGPQRQRREPIGRPLIGLRGLHAGLVEAKFGEGYYGRPDDRFKPQEALIDIQAIVELASSFGPAAISRAYCNWQWYGRYRDALLQKTADCSLELRVNSSTTGNPARPDPGDSHPSAIADLKGVGKKEAAARSSVARGEDVKPID
jgi:hypothetical protein